MSMRNGEQSKTSDDPVIGAQADDLNNFRKRVSLTEAESKEPVRLELNRLIDWL